jgi:inhibitor of cysteine peptidase
VAARLWLAVLGVLLSGCSMHASEVTLTEAQSGGSVELRPGQELVVHLGENPTTGYRWSVGPFDEAVLALESSEYAAAGSAPGGGGEHIFRFRARAPGTTSLTLGNVRPWEGETSAIGRFEATVRVQP